MVYGVVDEAGVEGIWSRHIQDRLSINQAPFNTAVKHLLSKRLIVPFKSVEHPNRKMFIKASIQPSERAAGGVWHNANGELDEAFIEEIKRVIFDVVKKRSTYHEKLDPLEPSTRKAPTNGTVTGPKLLPTSRKRPAEDLDSPSPLPTLSKPHESLLPLPAGYKKYPTVRDIARLLSTTGITTSSVLSEADVQVLVDVLVYDGLLEAVQIAGRKGYRLSRIPHQSLERWTAGRPDEGGPLQEQGMPEQYPSALVEAPCGKCPVVEICEEGGPVAPSNCVYFQHWLGLE